MPAGVARPGAVPRPVPRVVVAGLWHETNTFASGRTTVEDFRAWQYAEGADVVTEHLAVRDEVGGFLAALADAGAEPLPALYAAAVPSGTVTREAYDELAERLLARVDPTADGALLALHGAMAVDGLDDPEAVLVEAVRGRLPAGAPVVVTLDFHANISERLFASADVLLGYDTYPHVDPYDRAVEAARLLLEVLETGVRPAAAFRKLPLLIAPPAQATDQPPMSQVLGRVLDWEAQPGVRTVTFSGGFAYADVPWAGCAVAAYADTDALAAQVADDVAALALSLQPQFEVPVVPVELAVAEALAAPDGPTVLVDAADNIGGGSPGDGTVVLRELLRQGARGAVVTVVDPEAVAAAVAAGVGGRVRMPVGGRTDSHHGEPVEVDAVVATLTDGSYVHTGSYMTGQVADMGRTAVLHAGGTEVVVYERRMMPFDAAQLRSLGIEPSERHVLVVKSAVAWRAAYGEMARRSIIVDTPGVCASDLTTLAYTRAPQPGLVPDLAG